MLACVKSHLNFYRIHVLLFILIPLLFALIFWASNGKFKIKFVDALYVCVSAVTGTGLTTIDLSSLTAWQQVIIVFLELVGNQTFVAWIVVYVRRLYFLHHLEHIVSAEQERRSIRHDTILSRNTATSMRAFRKSLLSGRHQTPLTSSVRTQPSPAKRDVSGRIQPDMIRRVDVAPHLIDPMGMQAPTVLQDDVYTSGSRVPHTTGVSHLARVATRTSSARRSPSPGPIENGYFGGFPDPQTLISRVARRVFPKLHRNLQRTMTMPRTETLIPRAADGAPETAVGNTKQVPYISFRAIVDRNSAFHGLTSEQIEELGGVEYGALSALLWIIPVYYFGLLAISFVVTAPYMTLPRWRNNFIPPQQHRNINSIWFSAFQVVGAWANTGMSLVDQNMVPFRTAYPMIIFLVICVLAGNTALPIFLRFMIWILTKAFPDRSRTKEALHFLLDHPRRCTIYLFPAHQTWILVASVVVLNLIDWMFDLILNIGNPATKEIPIGTRIINAVLSAVAVRSAGYQSIPVSALVPAVQVLYLIMMYIAIFPIALSVRSTNVYEEKSLGVYEEIRDDDEELETMARWRMGSESRVVIWGRYLMRHARRQLSFDMWWLALSLFLLCIVERAPLMNTQNAAWFNIFALIFEAVSAYGTVGLSLGVPTANYSLSGKLHTLSKLILIAVMIRGRHRGLPVALDRAVLLPHEFRRRSEDRKEGQDNNKQSLVPVEPQQVEMVAENERSRSRTLSFAGEGRKDPLMASDVDHISEIELGETDGV
ncbi:hypothetical protein AcW1_007116 [Taiwanofungus camphoratus]|nr:hypothetical protein AcV7_005044 [Antrodia cinnamomea]KAI0952705.1 hypothetical protein AcW1_007116 [Antrodia cinnamomea]